MRKSIYAYIIALALPVITLMTSCEPRALTEEDVFTTSDSTELDKLLSQENPQGYRIYTLHEFLDAFMTEKGDFGNDTTPYRKRSTNGEDGIYLFSVDTIPTDTIGIYIRGRVTTDDFGGNFYKSMVIQQAVSWTLPGTDDLKQQNLRISVDMGSVNGLYQMGQELLIRCNGLAIGRYANQPQLCVPAYNNNVYAISAKEKVGWAPGRIPAAKFRNAVRMIGAPDRSKLQYDVYKNIEDLFDISQPGGVAMKPAVTIPEMDKVRKADGRLIKIQKVHFTGQYYTQSGDLEDCIYAHPDSSEYANVFAPTTNNIGYPQGRIVKGTKTSSPVICVSTSEYSKYANFFLPGALPDTTDAVSYCELWEGEITGILGWYCDNATGTKAGTLNKLTGKEWSITPRGIPGIGINDFDLEHVYSGDKWEGVNVLEFDPSYYYMYMHNE